MTHEQADDRTRRNKLSSIARIVAFMGLIATALPSHAEVVLRGVQWNLVIDPATLAVRGELPDSTKIVISSAREKTSHVAQLNFDEHHASWKWDEDHVAVSMKLDDDVLIVNFVAEKSGSMTWPVIRSESARQISYALPMFEGVNVPADDEAWGKFLVDAGAMSTTADLSMPFWGVVGQKHSVTYILTNPFNNELAFKRDGRTLGLTVAHEFTRNQPVKSFGYRIHLGEASPVAPAKLFRKHLIGTGQFVSMAEKIKKTPDAAKLLGAPHIYLWGDGLIARGDVRDYKKLAAKIIEQSKAKESSVGKHVWELMSEPARKLLAELLAKEFVDNYDKGQVAEELSRILKRRDFANGGDAAGKFYEAFSDFLNPVETWGDGFSKKMVQALADAGLDRAWLGSPNWDGLADHPAFVQKAKSLGYLVGPYDSFHSIHSPDETDTWETAQFDDRGLFESGAIVKADGSKRTGFKKKGHLLSPAAGRSIIEKRVTNLMSRFKCNSWFIDCDAFGDVFDDYSPDHPATQASDAAERLSRMAWIRDTFGAVIGSEGGSAYAAPVIHFAHGMMTPGIGWGDPDLMKDKQSKFYLGGYYPPEGPAVFFKQVPMKPEHRRIYADPRFRLPLYEVVFHDSVVATHQWGFGSLKFEDADRTRELLELLYNVPPLYHLNLAEWKKRKPQIIEHFKFFSPVHREAGTLPMTDFRWLSEDRLVQRATFGNAIEFAANFSEKAVEIDGIRLPAHHIFTRRLNEQGGTIYPAN